VNVMWLHIARCAVVRYVYIVFGKWGFGNEFKIQFIYRCKGLNRFATSSIMSKYKIYTLSVVNDQFVETFKDSTIRTNIKSFVRTAQ
jgi:hypothetical protein